MTILYILAALCVAFSVGSAVLRDKGIEKPRLVCKLTASLLFCLIGALGLSMREAPINRQAALMMAALILGFVGDILLGMDHLVKDEYQNFLLVMGGTPFFVGHLLYITLLLSYGAPRLWLLAILPVVPLVFFVCSRLKLFDAGKFMIPLLIYGVVLGGMVLSTWNLALQGGPLGGLMWAPGILFAISDTSLFMGKYGREALGRATKVVPYMVMLPYYGAQALFALSIVYL